MTNNIPASNGTTPTSYTLHVTNLPSDLEKEGVTSIFLEYGQVTAVMIVKGRNNTNQAYISYTKYNEAERAINELNEKLPLMLSIQFKDKNLKNIHKPAEFDLSYPITDFRYSDTPIDHTTPGIKKAIDMGRANCSPSFQSNTYTSEDELLYPVPEDPLTFNPYESAGPYRDTNLMYTRGIAHITKDGRRHISYGRGYTYYNLPEPHYNIASYLRNVCERREHGVYEYASEDLEDDSGSCKVCSAPTAFRCQKCGITFYCSRPCQVNDWPKHKVDCHPVPPLVKKVVNKTPVQNGFKIESSLKESEVQKPTPLRRPKTQSQHQQQLKTPPNEITRHNRENQRSPVSVAQPEKVSSVGSTVGARSPARSTRSNGSHHTTDENRNDLNRQTSAGNFKAVATSFPTKQQQPQTQNQRKIASKSNEDNIVFQSNTFIPKDRFIPVLVTTVLGKGEYYVQKPEDTAELENLFIKLENYVKTMKLIEPEENVKCILQHEKMWYRATIISLRDGLSKVFYHDFGTYEDVAVRAVCPINGFEDLPTYARRIRLVDGANSGLKTLKEDCTLLVKAVNVEANGTIVVQAQASPKRLENQTEPSVVDKMASCSIDDKVQATDIEIAYEKLMSKPHVLKTLKIGQEGLIILNAELSQGEFSASLIPASMMEDFAKLLDAMKEDCLAQVKENLNYIPKVGDLICGQSIEQEWFRGIVLSTKPVVKMAVIDEARVFIPIACTPMPANYVNIVSMGLVCKFLPNTQMPAVKIETASFEVVEISETANDSAMITISLEDPKFVGKTVVKKWTPKPEQKGIQWAPLTSGQDVTIIDFSSQNLIYARSKESKENERTHLLEQAVAKCALNRKPLTEIPVVGQMVLAHFTVDENFYRAIVTKVEGQKVMVKYVDYGNDEEATVERLFVLPEDLKEHPSCVTKIKLKGVNKDIPLTEEATIYIQQLIGGPVLLNCTFEGHPFEDGVVLKTPKNENVNERLKDLLKPTWEKENPKEDKKVYQIRDLPPLPLGNEGEEVQAIMLAYYADNGPALILGPNDVVAAEAIQVEMEGTIQKYVNTTTEHYIPRDNELCIAPYEGVYYRALCLETSVTPTESRLFFVDYGNTEAVKHTDIREITPDFLKFGAFATLCNISPTVPSDKLNAEVLQRISELISINDIVTIKIVSIADDNTPYVDVPQIRVKLIEEGLI